MHVTAIIAAGGRGQRFGGAEPKQLLSVGGRPILERSVDAFLAHPDDRRGRRRAAAGAGGRSAGVSARRRPSRCASSPAARGGRTRWRTRFARRRAASDVIVIHDAARPFASADLIARTIAAAAESGAALAAVPVARHGEAARRRSTAIGRPSARTCRAETLPRETIYLAQTPQAFRRDVLRRRAGARRARRRRRDRRGGAGRARRASGAARRRRGVEHQDHDAGGSGDGRGDRRDRDRAPRRAPARTGRAGTGYDLHRLVDGPAADPRRRDDSRPSAARSATPTPTSSAMR